MKIAVLHPGAMGASVCASLAGCEHEVFWVVEGRSEQTRKRGEPYDVLPSLQDLAEHVDAVFSVCPPDAAERLSREVWEADFRGRYVDANAIQPSRAAALGELWGERYVDGGIIGPPAWREGTTRLYLSGAGAPEVAAWFEGSALEAIALEGPPTAASALKMCYAAYTKGSSALLLAVRALAERLAVSAPLVAEWQRSQPGLDKRANGAAAGVGPKAWRFEGEMREISATFSEAGLPGGFHDAAAEFYALLAELKDREGVTLEDVLSVALRDGTRT